MFAKPLKLLLVASVALTATACSRNKEAPTQLAPSRMTSIGVNAYLFRAAVDTVSFATLLQADANSGIIITDWYENPEAKGEQFKLNVLILGTELRADGVRVSVFRRVGGKDVKANPEVGKDLEDKILTRARELRINGATDDE